MFTPICEVSVNPMSMLAIAASTVALGYALYRLHLGFWRKRLFSALPYAEEHRIPTEDGAHFELRRLPCETPDPEKPPVLLVHGLGANHRNHDAWEGASLARYLAARGSDVWLLTLRSGLPRGIPSRLVRFAAMVQHDVPQAVAEVRRRTGADAIDYVGFSMGWHAAVRGDRSLAPLDGRPKGGDHRFTRTGGAPPVGKVG